MKDIPCKDCDIWDVCAWFHKGYVNKDSVCPILKIKDKELTYNTEMVDNAFRIEDN